MNWVVRTSKSWWQCSWLKCSCKGQFLCQRDLESLVEAQWRLSRLALPFSTLESRAEKHLRECQAFVDALISAIAFFKLLCPSRSLVASVHFKRFKGRRDSMPLAVAPCPNAPPVKCHTVTCTQWCHAQLMLLESRDEHGTGTCNASFRQAASSTSPAGTELQRCIDWC